MANITFIISAQNNCGSCLLISPKSDINLDILAKSSQISKIVHTSFSLGILEQADNRFPLVISLLDLQNINNINLYLSEIKRVMMPSGFFITSFLGGDTIFELARYFTISELSFMNLLKEHEFSTLLQNTGFKEIEEVSDSFEMEYSNLLSILKDLAKKNGALLTDNLLNTNSTCPDALLSGRKDMATLKLVYASGFKDTVL